MKLIKDEVPGIGAEAAEGSSGWGAKSANRHPQVWYNIIERTMS